MGQISVGEWATATRIAETLADSWAMIQPSDSLRAAAIQLVGRYELRAGDALQLAAALQWCEDLPAGRVFLAADQRLRAAALAAGFDAKQM
jgi:predicted nucleic acid-binding protein